MAKYIKNILSQKLKLRKEIMRSVIYITLVVVLSILIYLSYIEYKKVNVVQQQQQMLGISKSISRSIELFTNDVADTMKIIVLDKDFVKASSLYEQQELTNFYSERLMAYYKAEEKSIDSVYFFDKSGKVRAQYPHGVINADTNLKSNIEAAIASKETLIGKVYLDSTRNEFVLNIYEPVFDRDNLKGVISVSISLDDIYNRLIAPVKVGEKGYAMVKDQYGTIIMHPVKEQVGMDVIETRKQVFPDLDYTELENLIKDQLTGREGTAIYHSYWWGDNVLKKVKKLSAYTPVQLGDHFWIVALTMSYDEIQGPVNKFAAIVIGIVSLIAAIIYVFFSALIKMKKNKEELEEETKYLKMLNEASEQLRKKEAELNHSHKLKMIGTLAGGIAHDINNLLTPILGYAELLLMRIPEESEYREDVDEIIRASQKGKELIDQILLFSRNDNSIVKVEPINFNEVTTETLKLIRAVLPKKIVIKEEIQQDSRCINANFTQIHQVIFNLCTNAYQAIKNDQGTIKISVKTVAGKEITGTDRIIEKDRDYVELNITDNGCGMDEETKARIFDPFFTTKSAGEGTGLGLFVVHNIIDKYNGIITFESELNRGSSFSVYFPLLDGETVQKQNDTEVNGVKRKKRILIVDDNETVGKVLKKGLEHLGFKVTMETSGKKALGLLKSGGKKFEIVITDYMMPEIKGTELAAYVKKLKKDTAVILMTGYMDENEKTIAASEFIDGYISKPVELANLAKIINKVSI